MGTASSIRSALVFGATGLIGKELVQQLIQRDEYNSVHIATRRKYPIIHEKLIEHIINFDDFTDFVPEARITDVFICLGTTMRKAGSKANFRKVDYDYVVAAGEWAKKHNCNSVAFVSSISANANSKSNFYLRTKGQAENALADLQLPSLLIVRPSLLVGEREKTRITEKLSYWLIHPKAFWMQGALEKYKAVYDYQVAAALIQFTLGSSGGVSIIENDTLIRFKTNTN